MMNKGKNLKKLVLATILAGSMVVGNSAFAAGDEDGDKTIYTTYTFDGKPFMNAAINMEDEEHSKADFRSFYPGEAEAISQSLNYWYNVLGAPNTVPDINIYLTNTMDSGSTGGSEADGDVTRLAKHFLESKTPESEYTDAAITVRDQASDKKWNFNKLSILPRNEGDRNYQAVFVHEMFHALGIMTSFDGDLEGENTITLDQDFTRYEKNLYDFQNHKLADSNNITVIDSSAAATEANTFYLIKDESALDKGNCFNGAYFKGKHVDEVLNLNGQQALLAWPDGATMPAVPGIPVNGVEPTDEDGTKFTVDLSHFELQNGMQSHQNYRNWAVPMEVELAALEDLGYKIDRRKFYGNSIYNSGTEGKPFEYVNTNPFYERVNGVYVEGKPSTQSLAIGLHVYGSNVNVLQKSNLLADGPESMGIRVDGVNNKLTIDKDSKVTANGLNGRGINFAYGKNHELNVEGTVTALGAGGKALAFDFGDNMLSNSSEYRGSYIRAFLDDGEVSFYADMPSALNGPLVKDVNISGTVAGNEAAIYISPNAYVKNINIKTGAVLQSDIVSDWSPKGGVPVFGEDIPLPAIELPDGDDGLTQLNFEGDNLNYAGDIRTAAYGIVMNVKSGSLNYEGEAKVDSVNVAQGAVLQGGTYNLNKDEDKTLTNEGMISAALPKNGNTVMTINGGVVNKGGSMAFIANGNYVGTIKIDGSFSGNKTLAVNPNGSYLPGDIFNVSNLVTFADDSAVEFTEAVPYETAMLKATYDEDYDYISFKAENNLHSNDATVNAAFDEMTNLARAVSASNNQAWQEKLGELYKFDSHKATEAMKSIKGKEAANTSVVMQQSNLVHNALGMRLSQVNRAKAVKVNVPVKQLAEGEPVNIPMDIEVQAEYDMWAKISRNKGAVNADSDYNTNAYSIGWDKQVGKDWRFGFFGSYANGKFEAESIHNKLEDYRLGVYGGYNKGAVEAMVYADYGWGKNKLNRSLRYLDVATSAKYNSHIMEMGAEYKYDLQHDKNKAWHVAPYGALQLNRYSQKGYHETGAEPFNKNVAKLNNTYAGLEAGVDLERRFVNGSAYGMRIGYRRGLTGVEPKQSYHYAADPDHRYTNYGEGDKNKLVLRLNGQVQTAPNWSISGEAGYERGKKGHGYSGEINLKYTW